MLSAIERAELTLRAVLAGVLIGAVLAAANVYTGLKTAFIDGGSITASVLAYAIFRRARRPYSSLENNLTQTVAASAAIMSMVAGVIGPVPALMLSGHTFSDALILPWALALSALGVGIAVLLREALIEREGLPFPTGSATAEVIAAMATAAGTAVRRARALLVCALLAGLVALLRDGPLALLPQEWIVPGALFGLSLATLSVGVSVSPLLLSTGLLMGGRASVSLFLGSALGWLVLAPLLVHLTIVTEPSHERLSDWLLWPGTALMLSSSLVELLFAWPSFVRGARDLRALLGDPRRLRGARSGRPLLLLLGSGAATVMLVAWLAWRLHPALTLMALLAAAALSGVCARSAGETDIAPVGAMGGLTQVLFGGQSGVASLAGGSVVAGTASQTAQTLWALKAGQQLGASVRMQVVGQLIGAAVGALVVVPTYSVIVRAYGLGTERMPAAGVMSWKATAEAVQGGLAGLPPQAAAASLAALLLGTLLTLLARSRYGRAVPSPVGLGIGLLTPLSICASVLLGGLLATWLVARHRALHDEYAGSLAGGAIAGESLLAVVLAALIASGFLPS